MISFLSQVVDQRLGGVNFNEVYVSTDTENAEKMPLESSDDHIHLTDTETPTRKKPNHGAIGPGQDVEAPRIVHANKIEADQELTKMDDEAAVSENTHGVVRISQHKVFVKLRGM